MLNFSELLRFAILSFTDSPQSVVLITTVCGLFLKRCKYDKQGNAKFRKKGIGNKRDF